MDISYALPVLAFIVIVGFYKTIDALERVAFALQAVNLHLDAIKKESRNSYDQVVKLLQSHDRALVELVEPTRTMHVPAIAAGPAES